MEKVASMNFLLLVLGRMERIGRVGTEGGPCGCDCGFGALFDIGVKWVFGIEPSTGFGFATMDFLLFSILTHQIAMGRNS